METLSGLREIFIMAIRCADPGFVPYLFKRWNEECDKIYENTKTLNAEAISKAKSDTAREIFAELDARLDKMTVIMNPHDGFITTFRKTMEKVTAEVEEIKRRYTVQFVRNYECKWFFEEDGGAE